MRESGHYLIRKASGEYVLTVKIPKRLNGRFEWSAYDIPVGSFFEGFADLQPGEVVKLEFSEVEGRGEQE